MSDKYVLVGSNVKSLTQSSKIELITQTLNF